MQFKTKVDSRDIDISHRLEGMTLQVTHTSTGKPQEYTIKEDDEVDFSDFIVNWFLDIEAREWGIKGLCIYAKRVHGSIFINEIDQEGNEINEYEYHITEKDCDELFKIETNDTQEERKFIDDISPCDIEIDLKDKVITVIF